MRPVTIEIKPGLFDVYLDSAQIMSQINAICTKMQIWADRFNRYADAKRYPKGDKWSTICGALFYASAMLSEIKETRPSEGGSISYVRQLIEEALSVLVVTAAETMVWERQEKTDE